VSVRRHSLWEWWDGFWFVPGSAKDLAAARIVLSVHALWIVLSRDLAGASGLPREFWLGVRSADRWRYLVFPGHPALEHGLQVALVAGLVMVALGVRVRATALIAALLLYHLAPLETLIWTPSPYERGLEISTLSMVVLAIAPSADAWGLAARQPRTDGQPSWEYRWPLVLLQLFVAQAYLFSGYSKLYRVGWGWVSAANLRHWLLVFNQEDQIAVFHALGRWIADRPTLCLAVAVGTLAFDLSFIVVVLWKRARIVYLPLALVFHAGILFSMNIAFLNVPQLLLFVDWDRLTTSRPAERGD